MDRAVFLDRDGTLIEDRDYLSRMEDVVIFPAVPSALQVLQAANFRLFIVTNQSGVGRGYFSMADVEKVHAHLVSEFARAGISFTKIYVAPEAPDQPSRGRKPSPQFLFDARDEFGIDLTSSYMVGDKVIDIECGQNAGLRKSILVRTGYGAQVERKGHPLLSKAIIVDDMRAAAEWIVGDAKRAS